ncbi:MAG: PD-(D/E)XK nuclease-like domain-containing protein, partial [Candidatus Babeliales bacterium]
MINLTVENYFSQDANSYYMSASQVKSFLACEAMALAEIKGEYAREKTTSLLVGSYVDAHYEKTLDL